MTGLRDSEMDRFAKHLGLIAGHSLFRDLNREELPRILLHLNGTIHAFGRGDRLDELMCAHPDQTLGCVLSGWAQVYKYDLWGNQSILDFLMPNYLLGCYNVFTDANLTDFRTIATEPGLVLLLDGGVLLHPPADSDFPLLAKLEKNLIALLSERSWRMLKKVDILSASSLREKILLYLSYEATYFGSMTFDIPFNRQEFADYLYIDRSSLSRELGRLKAEGVIDFERNHFTLFLPSTSKTI